MLVTKPLTRTRAIAVVAATAACLLGVTQLPADAKGGGNPRRTTTTTSTTTPPPIPTSLLMDVHTQPGEVRCDWNGCQQATNMVARLSEGPDIGPGIPDRVVFMTFGNGTGCTATTDMIGWAECTRGRRGSWSSRAGAS